MFMTSGGYKHVFGEQHQSNAYMVRLKNHETSNVESRSAKLMKLDGVKGIVQNTTSKKQHARRAEVSGIAAALKPIPFVIRSLLSEPSALSAPFGNQSTVRRPPRCGIQR